MPAPAADHPRDIADSSTFAEVELDAFSGRPNPRWRLSSDQNRELRMRLVALEPATRAMPSPPGLGYRGFVVRWPEQAPWRVFGGFAQQDDRIYETEQRELERWLLESSPEPLPLALQQIIQQDLPS